jgi:hypothetical protein
MTIKRELFWIGLGAAVAMCGAAGLARPCMAAPSAGAPSGAPAGSLFPEAVTDVAPSELGWMTPGGNYASPSAAPDGSTSGAGAVGPPGPSSQFSDYPRVLPPSAPPPQEIDPLHESTWFGRVA